MPGGPMTDDSRVVCETPTPGKQPTRILKWKYDLTREAVLNVVSRSEDGVEFRGDGYHAMGVEAAVGPHRELPAGPSVAHPPHRFTQEVGGATSGVRPALAQPAHQHVGSGGDPAAELSKEQLSKLGSVVRAPSLATTTVKLDMEVKGEIERVPGSVPQRLRRMV